MNWYQCNCNDQSLTFLTFLTSSATFSTTFLLASTLSLTTVLILSFGTGTSKPTCLTYQYGPPLFNPVHAL